MTVQGLFRVGGVCLALVCAACGERGSMELNLPSIVRAALNNDPTAVGDNPWVLPNSGATVIDVLANDTSAPDVGETLTVIAITPPAAGGNATLIAGVVRFTPNPGFVGSATFSYTISDGNGGTSVGGVNVAVAPPNANPPTASDDTLDMFEGSPPVTVPVLLNDTIAPDTGETLTITGVGPAGAAFAVDTSVTLGGGVVELLSGNILFTLTGNATGTFAFTYTVSDGRGNRCLTTNCDRDTATVTVTITGFNDPPVAFDDAATINEDAGATVINVLANDSSAPDVGETLSVVSVTQPATGGTSSLQGGVVSFTPTPNFNGVTTFSVTITDGNGGFATSTVTMTVRAQPDPPVVSVPGRQTLNEDTELTLTGATAITVSDADNDVLTVNLAVVAGLLRLGNAAAVTIVSGADNSGAMTIRGTPTALVTALAGLRFAPRANQNGETTLTVSASDATSTVGGSVVFAVTPVNDPPVPQNDTATATIDPIVVNVLANDTDVDGDTLLVARISGASGGSATVVTGGVRYVPTPGFSGTATIVFVVSDGRGAEVSSRLDVTVDGDRDNDGDPDVFDNCVDVSNPNQANLDGDALGDACDLDRDGDLINDAADNCPVLANANQNNLDGDAFGDVCDSDRDGDGRDNVFDNCPDAANSDQADRDNNGIGDACDADRDGDGIDNDDDNCPDIINTDQRDLDADDSGDVCDDDDDGDDVDDDVDNCPRNANADQRDTDADLTGDVCDADDDADGVNDADDNCPLGSNADQADLDGDDLGDVCDGDRDGDGIDDEDDNCVLVENADQLDLDDDGIGDACDLSVDRDGDGVTDGEDNCVELANADQRDTDNDGVGDVCDDDDDGDGVPDAIDNCPLHPNADQSDIDDDALGDPCDDERDGDGLANINDNCPSVPNADQANADNDGEGDVCDDDTDGDGISNDVDNCLTAPNFTQQDTNLDGDGDACDDDDDGDGVADGIDNCSKVANADQTDSDSNGIGDACQAVIDSSDDDGDGRPDELDNCPTVANTDQADVDLDGYGDACDSDDPFVVGGGGVVPGCSQNDAPSSALWVVALIGSGSLRRRRRR